MYAVTKVDRMPQSGDTSSSSFFHQHFPETKSHAGPEECTWPWGQRGADGEADQEQLRVEAKQHPQPPEA